jgi:hypothetical protein
MIARGKRRAERARRPWIKSIMAAKALKERNNSDDISHFQCSHQFTSVNQGRRASLRPDACPWLSYSAPSALRILNGYF